MQPPITDAAGIALFRHEAIGVVLQVRPSSADALQLQVLAWQRVREPYAGQWALPSGPVAPDESMDASVRRHLADRVDVAGLSHLEQLATLSDPQRDPAQRTIATAYLGIVPADADPRLPRSAAWLPISGLPELAFDHGSIVADAVARLRAKLSYTNLGFALAPADFTIKELTDIYAAALGRPVSATNLQRVLGRRGQLVATGQLSSHGAAGGRPAKRFRFAEQELTVTDPFAVLKPE